MNTQRNESGSATPNLVREGWVDTDNVLHPYVSDVSRHLIRQSVSIDPTEEGALYYLKLEHAKAQRALFATEPGSQESAEWLVLVEYLDDQCRIAQEWADSRFDPTGL